MTGDDDMDVWVQYARGVKKMGQSIEEKQIKAKPVAPKPDEPLFAEAIKKEIQETRRSVTATPPSLQVSPELSFQTGGLSKQSWKKEPLDLRIERNLSLGDVMIEAKKDLHGMSEQEAYDSFKAFVEEQQKRGKRMLLVITGKGHEGTSVLKQNLPRWCDAPPFDDAVMAVRTAAQHHGGEGAYYVLLSKRR
jgi:DNA-nicking Smr family endonuclease